MIGFNDKINNKFILLSIYRRLLRTSSCGELRRPKSTASTGKRRLPRRMDSEGRRTPRDANRCLFNI